MERQISVAPIEDVFDAYLKAGFVRAHSVREPSNCRRQFGARQRKLIRAVIEQLCPRFVPGGRVVYIGDAENGFLHLDADYLRQFGIRIPAPTKMPDVVVHDTKRNWLLLIEAVTSAGPVDGKRRKELKDLFRLSTAGLVFLSTFESRQTMRRFLRQISWETEVWVAAEPDHIVHFNGERFLGPYPDATPSALASETQGCRPGKEMSQ